MNPLPYEGACVLVLGSGPRARLARDLLTAAGARLARGFGSEVTYVVIDRTVPANDSAVTAARRAAVPVLTTHELQERPEMAELANLSAPPPPLATMVGMPPVPRMGRPQRRPGSMPPPIPMPPPGMVALPVPVPMPYPPRPMSGPPMPYPPTPPALLDINSVNTALGWAAATFLTGGVATPILVGHVAYRLRSRFLALAAGGYLAAWTAVFFTLFIAAPADSTMLAGIGLFSWLTCWLGGTTHAYLLGRDIHRAEGRGDSRDGRTPAMSHPGNAAALAKVEHRRMLRAEARALADRDSVAARELRIGRPDLSRKYDDGGLIDVNSAPASLLEQLPGVDAGVAAEIINHRELNGPFESTDEVVVHVVINPRAVEDFKEVALYLK